MQLCARIFRASHARIYHKCGNSKATAIGLELHCLCKESVGFSARVDLALAFQIAAKAVFLPVQANPPLSGMSGPKKVFPRLFTSCSSWADCK